MKNINCCLCKTNKFSQVLFPATFKKEDLSGGIYSARRIPDRIHYQIMKCRRCGLIYSSPIIDIQKIAKFYRESVCSYAEQIPYLIKTYFKLFVDIKSGLPKNPKVLEIGCGNGFFLEELKKAGLTRLFGVEPSKEMTKQTSQSIKQNIKTALFIKDLFPQGSFDLICCFHTLDHVVDPNTFIQDTQELLKQGGKALFVVHNTKGLSVQLFGEKSAIFDIEHIYLFDKKTLRAVFTQNGFQVEEVFEVVNSYPLYYWIRMAGIPKFLRAWGSKLLKITGLENLTLNLAAGNIGILARKT
ncbi:hypothetical protein A2631_01150 [Candidatus Daviesbacteria bacterium RIFCSPHIGHO2_01_FULL_44_29]|uniref:Methyltransferase type 11 domain-containing protein n=1 Tax=Candidatus Daviesbacteria bacterium RIFCSPHIGHO2_02_FULL_43_12 TaxID=1797776 RepID=A0A1F5KIP6_9BACT|nr:MAG: hypothetical protein A2631_01150 [Candidatus Daviesbacteria bacterium RIFCSPHIGHO2_01_FULL_44_29]OGE40410.1 MAG: hypothetical protein A3E86_03130 [Candidatus Daviesbacteria bacterium RIFCSPHIGHO2_12_FULL_47_45]OGE40719.1 MAG: hypothetical protein A3D25_05595 [Candidatus Daviesbacteria bacterium RIFCSPHIGHO2_02_FULL_43_12]OGE69784.1 MAG: hypothetical protein A3B55_05215 [Candidatus Daviesbacteria bacterium RIFCSPLOWO2_01_FULL_43_15]